MTTLALAVPTRADRSRAQEILGATGVFRDSEIDVALELFDESVDTGIDYELLGSYSAEGTLDGFACFGETPATDRTWDLYWIVVDPRRHGAGVGSALLRGVEDTLKERSARLLAVETSSRSDYAASREFYRRRGFTEAARVPDFYAPADDRVIYTKRLQPAIRQRGLAHGVVSQ